MLRTIRISKNFVKRNKHLPAVRQTVSKHEFYKMQDSLAMAYLPLFDQKNISNIILLDIIHKNIIKRPLRTSHMKRYIFRKKKEKKNWTFPLQTSIPEGISFTTVPLKRVLTIFHLLFHSLYISIFSRTSRIGGKKEIERKTQNAVSEGFGFWEGCLGY